MIFRLLGLFLNKKLCFLLIINAVALIEGALLTKYYYGASFRVLLGLLSYLPDEHYSYCLAALTRLPPVASFSLPPPLSPLTPHNYPLPYRPSPTASTGFSVSLLLTGPTQPHYY